jgi:hypothetical protein
VAGVLPGGTHLPAERDATHVTCVNTSLTRLAGGETYPYLHPASVGFTPE